eukprot:TRINITY_DN2553_c0_g1_i4.p1 TRINITY_DN2553_c0_g1~~TRINITY_DN2553_c0_g1_i4.p1  ORF type:complete len:439 (-),score=90.71 TRINITY_DN2553_c0_g1_i4:43-1359(-)
MMQHARNERLRNPCSCPAARTFIPPGPYTPSVGSANSIRCALCKFYFLRHQNSSNICRHHHGVYGLPVSTVGLGGIDHSIWTCCRDYDPRAPGCCEGPHVEDTITSAKLDAMFDPAQNPPHPILIEKDGIMQRQGQFFKNWRTRYYRLTNGTLYYYDSKETAHMLRGTVPLNGARLIIEQDYQVKGTPVIKIEYEGTKELRLHGRDTEDTYDWFHTLGAAAEQASNPQAKGKGAGKTTPPTTHAAPVSLVEAALDDINNTNAAAPSSAPSLYPTTHKVPSESSDGVPPPSHLNLHGASSMHPSHPSVPAGFTLVRHKVAVTDTLSGLALKFNTTARLIKEVNKMPTNEVYAYTELWIPHDGVAPIEDKSAPMSEEQTRRRAIKLFMTKTGVQDRDEAEYYMNENGWDFALAAAEYQGDVEWEKSTSVGVYSQQTVTPM